MHKRALVDLKLAIISFTIISLIEISKGDNETTEQWPYGRLWVAVAALYKTYRQGASR